MGGRGVNAGGVNDAPPCGRIEGGPEPRPNPTVFRRSLRGDSFGAVSTAGLRVGLVGLEGLWRPGGYPAGRAGVPGGFETGQGDRGGLVRKGHLGLA